ncbi:MAG: ATP-binding protein, partial [Chloroflexota bacterium]|nr:ATP-binding protein [Chloroflexota bacterium]
VLAEAPSDLPPVLADPDRLEQAVRNLVANAVRHTPPGGVVLLSAAPDQESILIQVKDTGEGIATEDLPHVWERFYRAGAARDRDGGGAGLGLALVKELTEAMGGSVAAESTPGAGSCFSLRLPAAPSPAVEGPPSSQGRCLLRPWPEGPQRGPRPPAIGLRPMGASSSAPTERSRAAEPATCSCPRTIAATRTKPATGLRQTDDRPATPTP